MKKISAIILSAATALSVCACGGGKANIGDCSGYIQRDIKWDMTIEDIESTIEHKKNDGVQDLENGSKTYAFGDAEMQSLNGTAVYNISETVNLFSFVFYDKVFVDAWYENYFVKKFGPGKKAGEDTSYQYPALLDGEKCIFTLYLDQDRISVKKD